MTCHPYTEFKLKREQGARPGRRMRDAASMYVFTGTQ